MYSLLIVDDEPLAQVGLKSMIDWGELGVEVIGTSPNGLHALEAIIRSRPDIVITDVRMPMLDGIGLLERCRAELDYSPAFIVLTGYADFESARRSIRCSVVDFLVKLELDGAGLKASVERAIRAVDERRRAGRVGGPAGDAPDPFAETALTRLLAGSYSDEAEARESLGRGGIDLGPGPYCVAYFKVSYPADERRSPEERLRAYRCAVDMIKELVGREAEIKVVPFDPESFAALLRVQDSDPGEAEAPRPEDRAAQAIARAREMTEKYFGLGLRAGLGSACGSLGRAAESYREALLAAGGGGPAGVAVFERRTAAGPSSRSGGGARRAAVAKAVAESSGDELRAIVADAIGELGSADQPDALALCCEILYPILEKREDGEALLDSLFPGEAEGYRCLFSAPSSARMSWWLSRVGEGLGAKLDAARARGNNPLAAGVRAYVRQNLEGKLALSDVARRFRVSPNHLSAVFKKYSGIGFSEYVAREKVERAKELIRGGRHKMFEVAQILGFEDAFYFSKVFKKVAGVSPREYYLATVEARVPGEPGASLPAPEGTRGEASQAEEAAPTVRTGSPDGPAPTDGKDG